MGKKSERGNVIEIVVIGILLLAIAGLIVWRVMDGNKSDTNQSQTSTQASDKTATGTETGQASTNSSDQQTGNTGADLNKGYIVIDDWGVRFKPSSSEKISYSKAAQGNGGYNFTTDTTQKVPGCADATLWLVSRRATKDEVAGGLLLNNGNKIGDYYYYYYHTQEMCARQKSDQATIDQQIKIVENLLLSIEAKQ